MAYYGTRYRVRGQSYGGNDRESA